MISIRNLKKSYGSNHVLHGIDLDVRAGEALGSLHAFDQLEDDVLIHGSLGADLVFLFDAFAGMRQSLGEISAIGEQDQPFAVLIQTPNVVKVLELGGQQIVDR